MALTIAATPSHINNMLVVTVAFDNNYQTGGLSLTPAQMGFGTGYVDEVAVPDKRGYMFSYDAVNQKLLAYVPGSAGSPDSEVTNGTDLSAVTGVVVLAFGNAE